jgi:hypothetical protein
VRKSTVILVAILLAGAVGLTLMLDFALGHVKTELQNRKALKETFKSELLAGAEVRLAYVAGGERYPVKDPKTFGLIVEASPSAARWTKDVNGLGLSHEIAEWAFQRYGPERPISWVLLRMRRSDESVVVHALRRGENDRLETIPVPPAKPSEKGR